MGQVRRNIAGTESVEIVQDGLGDPPLRLLVAITFHYSPARLPLLLSVARSFLSFPVAAIDLVVLTNTTVDGEVRRIAALIEPLVAPRVGEADPLRDIYWSKCDTT